MPLAPEFQFIHQYFKPLAGSGALALSDDAALLALNPNEELVLTSDAMVENVHFFADDPVDLIARKLLRCNLSDIAGMGAKPLGYLLTLSLPKRCFTHHWFKLFTKGLAQDQQQFDITLLGGDTTSNPTNIVFSVTMLGKVHKGKALRRNGAKVGDGIWVTGTIGDAALGLLSLEKKIKTDPYLINRYHLPQPRVGFNLNNIATAAMDISDGLLQDLGHLIRESKVGAIINSSDIPLSKEAKILSKHFLETCLTGGDDYELLFTLPVDKEDQLYFEAQQAGIKITKIGVCVDQPVGEVKLLDQNNQILKFNKTGWSHI